MLLLLRWLPAIIWMLVIFYLSHQPAENLDSILPLFHKLFPAMESFNWGHFVAYFILALTIYWGLGKKYANLKGKLITIGLCILYGVSDEYHQSFISGRHSDLIDLRNDAIGATLAMIFLSIPPLHRFYLKHLHSNKY